MTADLAEENPKDLKKTPDSDIFLHFAQMQSMQNRAKIGEEIKL